MCVCPIKQTLSRKEKKQTNLLVSSVHPQTALTTRHIKKEIREERAPFLSFKWRIEINDNVRHHRLQIHAHAAASMPARTWRTFLHYGAAMDVVKREMRRVGGGEGCGGENNGL